MHAGWGLVYWAGWQICEYLPLHSACWFFSLLLGGRIFLEGKINKLCLLDGEINKVSLLVGTSIKLVYWMLTKLIR